MKGLGHWTLNQDVPVLLPRRSRLERAPKQETASNQSVPPLPLLRVRPLGDGCAVSTRRCLLCSVVFSLRSNVPVAPWGARPARGVQRALAWDAHAPQDISSSWLAPLAAFGGHLLAQQPEEPSCCLPLRFPGSESGRWGWRLFSSPPLLSGNGFTAVP